MVRGVILAAGASSRMGSPKAALPLSHRSDTFLARLLRTYVVAGVPEIIVVTGSNAEVVRAAAGPTDPRVRFVHNDAWPTGQLSSLVTAVDAAAYAPDASNRLLEAVMVTLVDVPLVSADTCRRVLAAWRATRAPIVRPARGDVHGHPVIFDRALFDELRAADRETGAKAVVRAHAGAIVNVPIDDDGAFVDIDTVAEYEAALARGQSAAPSRGEGR